MNKYTRRSVTITAVLSCALVSIGSAPTSAQGSPLDVFVGSYDVVESTMPAPDARVLFQSVAGGRGIHSIWRHGSRDSLYEAHALWGYEQRSKQVQILEVNSAGVVAVHLGRFDAANALAVEHRDPIDQKVTERRVFSWRDAKTLEIQAEFITPKGTVRHVMMLRRK